MRFYEDIPAEQLANQLKSLGTSARKILAEAVEHQEIQRTKVSKSAEALYDAGFLFIRDDGVGFGQPAVLLPSLLGEEALELLEVEEEKEKAAKAAGCGKAAAKRSNRVPDT